MKIKQSKHCKGCRNHWNANHPSNSNMAQTYNDWCCRLGRTAKKAIGECELKGLKEPKDVNEIVS